MPCPRKVRHRSVWILILLIVTPAMAQSTPVANPGFEKDLRGWKAWPGGETIAIHDQEVAWEGNGSCRVSLDDPARPRVIYQPFRVQPNTVYRVSLACRYQLAHRPESANVEVRAAFQANGKGNGSAGTASHSIALPTDQKDWQHHQFLIVTPEDAEACQLSLRAQGAEGAIWYDAVTVEPSMALPIIHTPHPPTIDGRLDDACWKHATPVEGFWILEGTGEAPQAATTAYLAYDTEHFYIAFRNHEPYLAQLQAKATERDGTIWNDDCNEAFIADASGSGRHFMASCANIQFDALMYQVAEGDVYKERTEWNGRWQSATGKEDSAWTLEIAIPFSLFDQHPAPGQTWRVNLARQRYTEAPERSHWNRVVGRSFNVVEKFAQLRFDEGGAVLTRLVEPIIADPLAIKRAHPRFHELLTDQPIERIMGTWHHGTYLGDYSPAYQKRFTEDAWRKEQLNLLDQYGEGGMFGPYFPWVTKIGWDRLDHLNAKHGMRFPYFMYNSALNRRAIERGARWVDPRSGKATPIDPALVEVVKEAGAAFFSSDPRTLEYLAFVDGWDEPGNMTFGSFSRTLRPDDKAILDEVDQEIRVATGYGRYGLYDYWAEADDETPFRRIAFLRWWNGEMASRLAELYAFFKEIAPERPFFSFNINMVSHMGMLDMTLLSRHTDGVSNDPYPTSTLSFFGRDRAIYHTGFSTKLINDLSGGMLTRVMPQGFIYHGRGPTLDNVREWASQAMKNGADSLMWYVAGPARETIPEAYEEIIRVNRVIGNMNQLAIPKQTRTAILFSNISRWGSNDKAMHAHYTLYCLLGEQLQSWFRFVSDTQIIQNPEALDNYDLIYVPRLKYTQAKVVEALMDRARTGATVVVLDPEACSWSPDGAPLNELRIELLGTQARTPRDASHLDLAPALSTDESALAPVRPEQAIDNEGRKVALTIEALPEGSRVLAHYPDGQPAAFERPAGKGAIIWFAAQPFGDASQAVSQSPWTDFCRQLAARVGEPTGLAIWDFLIPAEGEGRHTSLKD